MKKSFIFTTALMVSTAVFAGSTIFGHKNRISNPSGVSSVGIHICGSLSCPKVIIRQGSCDDIEHATMQYGVCVCDDGYVVGDGFCAKEDANYEGVSCSDYISNKGCGGRGSGFYCQSPATDCTSGKTGVCHAIPSGWATTDDGRHEYHLMKTDWFTANSLCLAKGSDGLIASAIEGIPLNKTTDALSDSLQHQYLLNAIGTPGIFWTRYDANGKTTTSDPTTCGAYFVFTSEDYDFVSDPDRNTALSVLCE